LGDDKLPVSSINSTQLRQIASIPTSGSRALNVKLQSPFLRVLASAGRDVLSSLLEEKRFEAGQIVFQEGNPGNAMYIVWSGRVAVVKGDFASPTLLGYRGVGEIVGEMALLENETRSASVVVLEPARLLEITRENFEILLVQDPKLGVSILSVLSARLRAADNERKHIAHAESQLIERVSQLQTEKQQLLELERIRQDTIDLIVHDLRHPISSLFGAIKILEMVLPEDVLIENKQLLSIANSNCDHLQLMVESMLDVARMQDGSLKLNRRSISVQQFIIEAVNRVQILADMESITIEIVVPDQELTVEADEEKLYRILGNLLNNAVKYTPGGGQIRIMVIQEEDEVVFAIQDNGPGIPPEKREQVFDRFARLDNGSFRDRSGFGLGLAFCRMAVEAHGGNIWVDSGTDNVGSRFAFSLPVAVPTTPSITM
jgi:signal transduction histidine kinase